MFLVNNIRKLIRDFITVLFLSLEEKQAGLLIEWYQFQLPGISVYLSDIEFYLGFTDLSLSLIN